MLTIMIIFTGRLKELVHSADLMVRFSRRSKATVLKHLAEPSTVKDVIESLGIPHCELGPVEVFYSPGHWPGEPGGRRPLDALVRAGDVLMVQDPSPRHLPDPRFLCDSHLGKLALLLRIMGFDTLWQPDWTEPEIVRRGLNEQRTVLSRSRSLLKRRVMDDAMLIWPDQPDRQAAAVLRRFQLGPRVRMFGRCSRCNGLLQEVAKEAVANRIPPKTAKWLDTYYTCAECDHLFWEGTHVTALQARVAAILAASGPQPDADEA